jgi:hypothetical protein
MSRVLFLGTLLFVSPFLSVSWAQHNTEPTLVGLPASSETTFSWDYSCPDNTLCSFNCPGGGAASHVTKLRMHLGTIPVGSNQMAPALFYDFSTREIPHANGFSIQLGLGALSCQINGMTLDNSGPPTNATPGIPKSSNPMY